MTRVQKLMAAARRTKERRQLQAMQQAQSPQLSRRATAFARFGDWLRNLGEFGPFVLIVGFIGVFLAFDASVSEKRPIAAFFETLVALVVGLAVFLGPLFAAAWIGDKVAARTTRKKLVFFVGLVLWWCVTAALYYGALHLPWIGWRLERIF